MRLNLETFHGRTKVLQIRRMPFKIACHYPKERRDMLPLPCYHQRSAVSLHQSHSLVRMRNILDQQHAVTPFFSSTSLSDSTMCNSINRNILAAIPHWQICFRHQNRQQFVSDQEARRKSEDSHKHTHITVLIRSVTAHGHGTWCYYRTLADACCLPLRLGKTQKNHNHFGESLATLSSHQGKSDLFFDLPAFFHLVR